MRADMGCFPKMMSMRRSWCSPGRKWAAWCGWHWRACGSDLRVKQFEHGQRREQCFWIWCEECCHCVHDCCGRRRIDCCVLDEGVFWKFWFPTALLAGFVRQLGLVSKLHVYWLLSPFDPRQWGPYIIYHITLILRLSGMIWNLFVVSGSDNCRLQLLLLGFKPSNSFHLILSPHSAWFYLPARMVV